MKNFNCIIFLILITGIYSCSFQNECNPENNNINIKQISQEFNNEFEVYEGDYSKLKSNSPFNYTVETIGFLDAKDSLFETKVENNSDSIKILISDKGDLKIEYEYYSAGESPIVPVSIDKKNHLIIRGKTFLEIETLCDNDEKFVVEKMYFMSSNLFKLSIDIPKDKIGSKKFIIFEPMKDKSYIIDLKNEAVYS